MIKRTIIQSLVKALDQMPAVALLGPRQVGKTTLAKALAKQSISIWNHLKISLD
jgi:predicted AAA+ superfamily ATPase